MGLFDGGWPVLRRVIVNTKSGRAFRGVLFRRRRQYLLLRNAELLKPGGETAALDGEVLVPAENIDFVQAV